MSRRAAILVAALLLWSATARAGGLEPQLAGLFPSGALVFMEAQDLGGLVDGVQKMEAGLLFRKSGAAEAFGRSKLALKLTDRGQRLSEFLGEEVTLRKLFGLTTERLGLALYDIGELEFLVIARQRPGAAPALGFVRSRSGFEQRTLAGREYFVKSDENGLSFAFTIEGDDLLLSNSVSRIEAALQCLADPKGPDSLYADARLNDVLAEQPLHPEIQGRLFLYLDQEAIAGTSYFKVYWIYGNQAELEPLRAVGIWFDLAGDGKISEHRLLLSEPARDYKPERTLDLGRLPESCLTHLSAYGADRPYSLKRLDALLGLDLAKAGNAALDPRHVWAAAEVVRPRVSADTGVLTTARLVALLPDKTPTAPTLSSLTFAIEERLKSQLLILPPKLAFQRGEGNVLTLQLAPGRALYAAEGQGGVLLLSNDLELLRAGLAEARGRDAAGSLVIESGAAPARRLAADVRAGLQALGRGSLWSDWSSKEFFEQVGAGYIDSLAAFGNISYEVRHFGRFDYEILRLEP